MKRRLLALTGLVGLLTTLLLVGLDVVAAADEPQAQGWWTVANAGVGPGTPPPDVPSDGLLVQGGAASPSALAALAYVVPAGDTVGQLVLTVARPSGTTPNAKLEACPLTSPAVVPEQGGPMADAPQYNCAHKVTAAPSKDGKTYSFSVAALVANGAVAVAIVPTSSTDRVVFSKPGPSSLAVTAPPTDTSSTFPVSAAPPAETSTNPPPAAAPAGGTALAAPPPVQPAPAGPVAPAENAPAPQVAPNPTPTASTSQGAFTTAAAGTGGGKASTAAVIVTVGGLALAAAFWAFAGRNTAEPSLAD